MEPVKKTMVSGHSAWLMGSRALIVHLNRHGGVSQPPFDTLNLSLTPESAGRERPENVTENLLRAARISGAQQLAGLRQVHGTEMVEVSSDLKANDAALPGRQADGLMTSAAGVGLLIRTADCQALTLVDPLLPAAANLHCGWRGIAAGLIPKGVKAMKRRFGSEASRLIAVIGPSIGPCCAEFKGWKRLLPAWMHRFVNHRSHIDLWAASSEALMAAGILRENIYIEGTCTRCSPDYFSYRRERLTGRNGTIVVLS